MMYEETMQGGYARARAMRGRYRAAPREERIRGGEMGKALLLVLGMVTMMMVIAFA